ncbi:MAG: hypothetical protein JWN32_2863 [Solirubrobacterales bacterium]|jgi:hypothetical protein|nr:hypothetical protein [Solirubrobacterales bacterium]
MAHSSFALPARPQALPANLERLRVRLADGAATTVHVATYEATDTAVRVVRLRRLEQLVSWCWRSGVDEALVGGFFIREEARPLGELRTRGIVRRTVPFATPWRDVRACVHSTGGRVAIARRPELPTFPRGDLLQAGPMLVRGGEAAIRDGEDVEGFSAGAGQFDSDITVGRYPRTAFGVTGDGKLLAVVADGRAAADAGLTLGELAGFLVELGARDALNLDGGGSASLVSGGILRNVPRGEWETPISGGRPISTALVFQAR